MSEGVKDFIIAIVGFIAGWVCDRFFRPPRP